MAVVRRASLLQYFYTGRKLEADFPGLKAAAEGARFLIQNLGHQDASRFAVRHGKRLDTGGLVGHLDLDMAGLDTLWPYLHLGQWFNVGKNASMGYGHYVLNQPTGDTQCTLILAEQPLPPGKQSRSPLSRLRKRRLQRYFRGSAAPECSGRGWD